MIWRRNCASYARCCHARSADATVVCCARSAPQPRPYWRTLRGRFILPPRALNRALRPSTFAVGEALIVVFLQVRQFAAKPAYLTVSGHRCLTRGLRPHLRLVEPSWPNRITVTRKSRRNWSAKPAVPRSSDAVPAARLNRQLTPRLHRPIPTLRRRSHEAFVA